MKYNAYYLLQPYAMVRHWTTSSLYKQIMVKWTFEYEQKLGTNLRNTLNIWYEWGKGIRKNYTIYVEFRFVMIFEWVTFFGMILNLLLFCIVGRVFDINYLDSSVIPAVSLTSKGCLCFVLTINHWYCNFDINSIWDIQEAFLLL